MASQPVIIFDYGRLWNPESWFLNSLFSQNTEGSPYAQKIRLLLDAAGIPFKRCDQPPVLPRPDLKGLGIRYRRIPVLAIGKDFYGDTSCIIDAIQSQFPSKALPTSPADEAYNAFGSRTFQGALFMIPSLQQVGEYFLKDREGIFRKFENLWLVSESIHSYSFLEYMINPCCSCSSSSRLRRAPSKCAGSLQRSSRYSREWILGRSSMDWG